MRVFFSAGEASGDAYAAALIEALRERARRQLQALLPEPEAVNLLVALEEIGIDVEDPTIQQHRQNPTALATWGLAHLVQTGTPSEREFRFSGIGGPRMRAAGAALVADSSRWGAIGIVESIRVGPRVLRGYRRALRALASGRPGVFVPIDFGFLNIRLAKAAKAKGWKVLYFIPPGSWRRDRQGADLGTLSHEIVTPFSWSAEILNRMGAAAHWFGHPLLDLVEQVPDQPRTPTLAALPGSRLHEVELNMRVIAETVRGLGLPVVFAVAQNLRVAPVRRAWQRLSSEPAEFLHGETIRVLKSARAAVVCSGTATLEAALCDCPTVVIYRGSKLLEMEYRIRKPKFDFFALPNILLGRRAVPELLQWDATPDRIRTELTALLEEGPARQAQLAAFQELREVCGNPGCLAKTAERIGQMSPSSVQGNG